MQFFIKELLCVENKLFVVYNGIYELEIARVQMNIVDYAILHLNTN